MNSFESHRKAAKKTQREVADILGIDRSTVTKWETGKALPNVYMLWRVSKLYGCSMEELVAGADKPA